MCDGVLEGKFESGLKEEIQSELRKLRPVGLKSKMVMAQLIEDDNILQAKLQSEGHIKGNSKGGLNGATSTTSGGGSGSSLTRSLTVQSNKGSMTSSTSITPAMASKKSFKCMTDSEMCAKREKGLCYRCDKKFSPRHRCKKKELQELVVTVEQEVDDEGGKEAE